MINSASIEDFVGSYLHIAGYDTMSFGKLITIWYKRSTFRQLVSELADIWPVSIKDKEAAQIKRDSLSALKHRQIWVISVCCMLGSDLLFMTMSSHISMLLRLLQVQIRRLGTTGSSNENLENCYQDIAAVVQIHQRLIKYINHLEDAFSVVNLINVLLSSVNICCVVFTIVFLEPWIEMSNKFFLGAALTQMGIVCWYADDIYRASVGVSDAVYESGWYNSDARSRRLLLVVLQRSQKPLYFTALKFRSITMSTYSSILTTAYSYFTLLYTSYRRD
ncbi:odorant receptor 4 [Manduca sexta]|uniref:odorant receptor 4 n=1 Tax=Manduca sexta TaxID=7130 RepID=UPI00188F15CE|nr:odorant receptor 4 [Manduca sexta]